MNMVMITKVILAIDDGKHERLRNKVIHGASTPIRSRFRGKPDVKDLSDIFVYHVASVLLWGI